jgi:hypothetical protein
MDVGLGESSVWKVTSVATEESAARSRSGGPEESFNHAARLFDDQYRLVRTTKREHRISDWPDYFAIHAADRSASKAPGVAYCEDAELAPTRAPRLGRHIISPSLKPRERILPVVLMTSAFAQLERDAAIHPKAVVWHFSRTRTLKWRLRG